MDLQALVQRIAQVVNAVYSMFSGGGVLPGLFNLIGPLKELVGMDLKACEAALVGLNQEARQALEASFVSDLTIPQATKDKFAQVGGYLEDLIGIIRIEIVEYEDVTELVQNVKKLLGV